MSGRLFIETKGRNDSILGGVAIEIKLFPLQPVKAGQRDAGRRSGVGLTQALIQQPLDFYQFLCRGRRCSATNAPTAMHGLRAPYGPQQFPERSFKARQRLPRICILPIHSLALSSVTSER